MCELQKRGREKPHYGETTQHAPTQTPCNQPAIAVLTNAQTPDPLLLCVGLLCLLRGCIALGFGSVVYGLHCFLRLSSAGLIAAFVPGCCWACWAYSALSA